MTKTVADLKVGDEVALRVGMSTSYYLYKIIDIDKRGILTLENGTRYRANGSPMAKGGKWSNSADILPVTDTIRQTIRKERLVSQLAGLNYNHWKAMPLETLEAIVALVWKPE